jgi:hypothetical protein
MKKPLLVTAIALLALANAASAADTKMRLVSIPLGMPESSDFALDNQFLEGLYNGDYGKNMPHNFGGYLGGNVKSSGLEESPFYHIDTTLKDGRTRELWFSSKNDGRKVFGVQMQMPYSDKPPTKSYASARKELETAYGQPDLELSPPTYAGQHVTIFVDRNAPNYQALLSSLPKANQVSGKDADAFWHIDLQTLARILGPNFQGAIVIQTEQKGKLTGETAELVDLVRARTVFNLEDVK